MHPLRRTDFGTKRTQFTTGPLQTIGRTTITTVTESLCQEEQNAGQEKWEERRWTRCEKQKHSKK